jgi:hypothetical protein
MSAMPETLPDMVPVLADAERSRIRLEPELPVNFQFKWHGIPFTARVERSDAGPRLLLVGDLGPVPFSAEDAEGRRRLLSLAKWVDAKGACRFAVGQRHHLNLLGESRIAAPLTGTTIVAAATNCLLEARPYIDLVEEQRAA